MKSEIMTDRRIEGLITKFHVQKLEQLINKLLYRTVKSDKITENKRYLCDLMILVDSDLVYYFFFLFYICPGFIPCIALNIIAEKN